MIELLSTHNEQYILECLRQSQHTALRKIMSFLYNDIKTLLLDFPIKFQDTERLWSHVLIKVGKHINAALEKSVGWIYHTSLYIPGHQKIPKRKVHPAPASKDLNMFLGSGSILLFHFLRSVFIVLRCIIGIITGPKRQKIKII